MSIRDFLRDFQARGEGTFDCAFGCGNRVSAPASICLACLIDESVANAAVDRQREADLREVRSLRLVQ